MAINIYYKLMWKNNKIKIIVGAVILIIIIVGLIIFLNRDTGEGTIEKLLGVKLNDIAYIKTGGVYEQDEDYDVDQFINEYKKAKFVKSATEYGSTTHKYYICYDKNNKVLFTLVDIGNKNLYFLKEGEFNINADKGFLYELQK